MRKFAGKQRANPGIIGGVQGYKSTGLKTRHYEKLKTYPQNTRVRNPILIL
jgi:hypothetical protein